MNLSFKKLPKGLITLESIFNPNDQARGKGLNLDTSKDDHMPAAIANGKTLSLGKVCSKIEQDFFFIYVQNSMIYFHGHKMI